MNMLSISKENKEVIVKLSSDELVKLCNILYHVKDADKNAMYYKLYGEMMLARDLSQYGHVDDVCFESIAECREKLKID